MRCDERGVTLIEIVITIAIISAIFGVSAIGAFQVSKRLHISSADTGIINMFSSAARKARNGEGQSDWGVYLPYDEETRELSEVIVFKGSSYATRDTDADIVYSMSDVIKFTDVSLSGAGMSSGDDHEIVFATLTGATDGYGSIILTVYGDERTIEVSADGFVTREY